MNSQEFRKLPPRTRVGWDLDVNASGIVCCNCARPGHYARTGHAVWIEWSDGERTEDWDAGSIAHVFVKTPVNNPGRLS
jgi:hypothetical protein